MNADEELAPARNMGGGTFIRYRVRRAVSWATGMLFTSLSALTVILVPALFVALLIRSWTLVSTVPLTRLLASTEWRPLSRAFGFAPFIAGSLWVTAIALLVAVPVALLSAIYLAEYAHPRTRTMLKPLIELLAGIPSVVYGLWGVLVIVPAVRQLATLTGADNLTGYSMLSGGLVLAVMVIPFILALSEEVLRAVPHGLREATLALGATQWEVIKDVVWRQARGGIMAAVVLGFARAFGETLAVLMVVGNVVQLPRSPLDAGYTLPALIANNFGEMMSIPLYDAALMSAALILFMIVFSFNFGARLALRRVEEHA